MVFTNKVAISPCLLFVRFICLSVCTLVCLICMFVCCPCLFTCTFWLAEGFVCGKKHVTNTSLVSYVALPVKGQWRISVTFWRPVIAVLPVWRHAQPGTFLALSNTCPPPAYPFHFQSVFRSMKSRSVKNKKDACWNLLIMTDIIGVQCWMVELSCFWKMTQTLRMCIDRPTNQSIGYWPFDYLFVLPIVCVYVAATCLLFMFFLLIWIVVQIEKLIFYSWRFNLMWCR